MVCEKVTGIYAMMMMRRRKKKREIFLGERVQIRYLASLVMIWLHEYG